MIVDSIGFAATHSITEILGEVPNSIVSHGSRNFEVRKRLGNDDVDVFEFARQVSHRMSEGHACFALHTIYHPSDLKRACEKEGVPCKILVRRPEAQVRSCFSWAVKKIINGDQGAFIKMLESYTKMIRPSGVPATLSNCAYAFAASHVMNFNISAIASGVEIIRMEEVLSSKEAFCEAFGLSEDNKLSYFEGNEFQRASHKSKLSDLGLAEPDIGRLQSCLSPAVNGRTYSWKEFEDLLGYSDDSQG